MSLNKIIINPSVGGGKPISHTIKANYYKMGVCDFGDIDFLTPGEMALILEHGMTYGQYAEWRDANLENHDHLINLRSWLMGARHEVLKRR